MAQAILTQKTITDDLKITALKIDTSLFDDVVGKFYSVSAQGKRTYFDTDFFKIVFDDGSVFFDNTLNPDWFSQYFISEKIKELTVKNI